MEWGGFDTLAAALPDGESVPLPDVPDGLVWVWRAWHRLHLDRPWISGGMGAAVPCRIPWGAVRGWCEFHDYPGETVGYLDRLFGEMDAEFMTWRTARQASAEG